MPARQALEWYLGCRRGYAVVPEDNGSLGEKRLELMPFGEDPMWPNLTCVPYREDAIPFCPQWHSCPRVHRLISLSDFDPSRLWDRKEERDSAAAFLTTHFHFNISDFPELMGAVFLVAPNPMFRELTSRMQQHEGAKGEHLYVKLSPRAGVSIDGLELSIYEERLHGDSSVARVRMKSPLLRIAFAQRTGAQRYEVFDSRRGVLHKCTRAPIGGFDFSVGIKSNSIREVEVPAVANRPAERYEVEASHIEATRFRLGDKPLASALGRLHRSSISRDEHRAEMALKQRWFDDEVDNATNVLRTLLHAAKNEVMIVDPYFAAVDLQRFVPAVHNASVPVQLLASTKLMYKDDIFPERKKWEVLEEQLIRLRKTPEMNGVMVRVMKGSSEPDIHDRFFVIDNRVWILGSSLNQFGGRGTMLVELPYPRPIRERLNAVWADAIAFDVWIKRRKGIPDSSGGATA